MSYGDWTEEEDAVFRRMWKSGETVKAIAVALERHNPRHIRYRRRRLGLPRRRFRSGERTLISVSMPVAVKEALESRLAGIGRPLSTHIRSLILRDLGMQ